MSNTNFFNRYNTFRFSWSEYIILVTIFSQEKRRMTTSLGVEPDGLCGQFSCSTKELKELMSLRGHEAYNKIQQDYNGVLEICRRLQTSPTEGEAIFLAAYSGAWAESFRSVCHIDFAWNCGRSTHPRFVFVSDCIGWNVLAEFGFGLFLSAWPISTAVQILPMFFLISSDGRIFFEKYWNMNLRGRALLKLSKWRTAGSRAMFVFGM